MSFFDIIQAFLPLIIIGGLLYGVLYYVRKFGAKRMNHEGIPGIRVISTQSIMPKKHISIIKINESYLVVGMTEASMTILKELSADDVKIDAFYENENKNIISMIKKNIPFR